MREEAVGVFFSAKQPSTRYDTILPQRRVSTCAANLCMEKLFALCQHGGRDENASLSPFTRSRLQEKENPSLFVRLPPPPSIDEIRCSTKFDRLSKGRGNNRNFSTMEPRISRLKRSFTHSFIRLSWCISNVVARNSNKWRTLGCFYHLLPPPPPSLQVKTYTATRDRSETRLRRSNGASNFLHPSCSFQPVVLPFLGRGGGRRARVSTVANLDVATTSRRLALI